MKKGAEKKNVGGGNEGGGEEERKRERNSRTNRGTEEINTILTLYSIINPRSSDLCIFVTCFANCSTGMGGWSASLISSPGAASSFFLAPETQPRRIILTPAMNCLNTNDFTQCCLLTGAS